MIETLDRSAESPSRRGHAQLTNMRLALATLMKAQEAGEGSPRLCLLYGPPGYGKSVALAYLAAQFGAAYVEAMSLSTTRSFLESIAEELGIAKPEKTSPRLLAQIIRSLQVEPRPLLIDEMDYLVKKHLVDVIRDIHDHTGIPIMLVGMEALPAKLKSWEQFDSRIIASTAAQPATPEDARKLRDHYCHRVELADDLLAEIVSATKGVTRRIVNNLREVQSAALDSGRDAVDLAWWKAERGAFLTGDLPTRRKAA